MLRHWSLRVFRDYLTEILTCGWQNSRNIDGERACREWSGVWDLSCPVELTCIVVAFESLVDRAVVAEYRQSLLEFLLCVLAPACCSSPTSDAWRESSDESRVTSVEWRVTSDDVSIVNSICAIANVGFSAERRDGLHFRCLVGVCWLFIVQSQCFVFPEFLRLSLIFLLCTTCTILC